MTDLTETIRRRYNRIAPLYNKMDTMVKDAWRNGLVAQATGKVLEVGVGTGANLPHYPAQVDLIGIDFSPRMLSFAQKQVNACTAHSVQLLQMDAQHLDFPEDTFDTVVSTCVFCSVPDPLAGLREIHRVLKPDGRLLMIEHMLSDRPLIALMLHAMNPLTVRISGANVNRRTMDTLRHAGFAVTDVQMLAMGDVVRRIMATPVHRGKR